MQTVQKWILKRKKIYFSLGILLIFSLFIGVWVYFRNEQTIAPEEEYYVFYDATADKYLQKACMALDGYFDDVGKVVSEKQDALAREYEIWIGKADSPRMLAYAEDIGLYDYRICTHEQKLIVVGGSDAALVNAIKNLQQTKQTRIRRLVKSGYTYSYDGADTREEYIENPNKFLCNWALEFNVPGWMKDYKEKQAAFADADGRMMSAFHRADAIYYPENSIEGIISAIQMGADTVELDLCLTKDNIVVLLHSTDLMGATDFTELSGTEGLPSSNDVRDWTYEQLLQLRLKKDGQVTDYLIPTFEEALQVCKGHTTIWLDKTDLWSWDEDVYPLIKKHQAWETCILPVTYDVDTNVAIAKRIEKDSGGVRPYSYVAWGPSHGKQVLDLELEVLPFWYQTIVSSMDIANNRHLLTSVKGKIRILAQAHSGVGGPETPEQWKVLFDGGVNYVLVDNGIALQQYIAENFSATKY